MNAVDLIGWGVIGYVTYQALHSFKGASVDPSSVPGIPSVQREVDVTRYRHDGSQPVNDTLPLRYASEYPVVSEILQSL